MSASVRIKGLAGHGGKVVCLVALAVALTMPGRAAADTSGDKRRATTLLQEGVKLLDHKDFGPALERFTEAYRLVASAKIQFNIGLAQEGLDHPAEAIRAYRIYLDEATGDLSTRRSDARVRIDALRPHVTLVTVVTDAPGAALLIDGAEEGHTPLARPIVVNPGPHRVEVRFAPVSIPWTQAIVGEAGAKLELRATPPVALTAANPLPTPRPEPIVEQPRPIEPAPADDGPPASKPVYKKAWFWGVVAGAVVAGTVGAVVATRGGGSTDFPCAAGLMCIRPEK